MVGVDALQQLLLGKETEVLLQDQVVHLEGRLEHFVARHF